MGIHTQEEINDMAYSLLRLSKENDELGRIADSRKVIIEGLEDEIEALEEIIASMQRRMDMD